MKRILVLLFTLSFVLMANAADKVEMVVTELGHGLYMLKGQGGNIGVSIGDDGVYMIDDQYAPLSTQIREELDKLDKRAIKFVINTHWHGDHTGGNENFGAHGAVVLAHDNVRERMSQPQFMDHIQKDIPASPYEALPVLTFNNEMSLHFNKLHARVMHVEHAHTDGDAIVVFNDVNIVHMGDLLFAGMYPFIDLSSGGSVGGYIAGLEFSLDYMNDNTQVIPGHGPLTNKQEIVSMVAMLKDVRSQVLRAKKAGKSLDDIIAMKPTAPYDEKRNGGWIKADSLVGFVYHSID